MDRDKGRLHPRARMARIGTAIIVLSAGVVACISGGGGGDTDPNPAIQANNSGKDRSLTAQAVAESIRATQAAATAQTRDNIMLIGDVTPYSPIK